MICGINLGQKKKIMKCRNRSQSVKVKTASLLILTFLGQYKMLASIMQYNIALISENPVYTEPQIDTDRSLFAG